MNVEFHICPVDQDFSLCCSKLLYIFYTLRNIYWNINYDVSSIFVVLSIFTLYILRLWYKMYTNLEFSSLPSQLSLLWFCVDIFVYCDHQYEWTCFYILYFYFYVTCYKYCLWYNICLDLHIYMILFVHHSFLYFTLSLWDNFPNV